MFETVTILPIGQSIQGVVTSVRLWMNQELLDKLSNVEIVSSNTMGLDKIRGTKGVIWVRARTSSQAVVCSRWLRRDKVLDSVT
ncbi:hypothetical protein MPTK1_1g13500 [Marchantia polymorpha subsp. ruderalis]|uniref:Uncharacterized protein n=2 Tax=Marchantia polymorpha TaxID=3197 RepID=A0AAF6APR3_MARPO|nr:hypothetical protein MARPO_0019s0120 [Marchantia polymorpha]BBM98433.1 hypothetical protein Mp_1g13500 [Marchantia polymorpha subsp. ruderalis]|eukprot:PTQ44703.1 hypothetical protein MARPO_0019s0120 [Marchantia polymorpha]